MTASVSPTSSASGLPAVASFTDTALNQLLYWLHLSQLFSYPPDGSTETFYESNGAQCRYRILTRIAPFSHLAGMDHDAAILAVHWSNLQVDLTCDDADGYFAQSTYWIDGDVHLKLRPATPDDIPLVREYVGCGARDLLAGTVASLAVDPVSLRIREQVAPMLQNPLAQRMDDELVAKSIEVGLVALVKSLACEAGSEAFMAPLSPEAYASRQAFCDSYGLPDSYLMYYRMAPSPIPGMRGDYLVRQLEVNAGHPQIDLGLVDGGGLCATPEPTPCQPGTPGCDTCVPETECGGACGITQDDGCGGTVVCGCPEGQYCKLGLCQGQAPQVRPSWTGTKTDGAEGSEIGR